MQIKFRHIVFGILLVLGVVSTVVAQQRPPQAESFVFNVKGDMQPMDKLVLKKFSEEKPIDYPYVHDHDILWAYIVVEAIDLKERINLPLYYPIDTLNVQSYRRSLFDVLMKNVKSGRIKNLYGDQFMRTKRTLKDLEATLVKVDTTDMGYEQFNAGETVSPEYINKREITAADVKQYLIRGSWYFDKRLGELKYRLFSIAPVVPDVNFIDDDNVDPNDNLIPLFWIWYPEIRNLMQESKVFNPDNLFHPYTFDDIFQSRRFNSIFIAEDNIYDNRQIKEYLKDNALFQLLESNRIKDAIRNREIDMWNY
jgi:gliding motility associated protien GldN